MPKRKIFRNRVVDVHGRTYFSNTPTTADVNDEVNGYSYMQWVTATGICDSEYHDYDLLGAWRAGEDPEDYLRD